MNRFSVNINLLKMKKKVSKIYLEDQFMWIIVLSLLRIIFIIIVLNFFILYKPKQWDKFSNRYVQKWIILAIISEELISHTEFLIIPDIIVYSHAFLSRMILRTFLNKIFIRKYMEVKIDKIFLVLT